MEITQQKEQETLMVRLRSSLEDLTQVMGEVYGEIGAFAAQKGIQLLGAPYAKYYNKDMANLDVEMGFPVQKATSEKGRIKKGRIPQGQMVSTIHIGPYDKLQESYKEILGFMDEKQIIPEDWMYEFYLNSPLEVGAEQLQTKVCFPIK